MFDIYFDDNYGKLYEKAENGTACVYRFECEYGKVSTQFIKRVIPLAGGKYCDIVTPYGYGGPIVTECLDDKKAELCKAFDAAFTAYANENGIVSEFVRFHPILGNANDFREMFEVSAIRNTVTTCIAETDDPIAYDFSRSARKDIARALRANVTYRVTRSPKNVDVFLSIYNSTMDRNSASEYYYFGEEYFLRCLELFSDKVILVEAIYQDKTIAAGFYFICGDIIEAHLSGTLSEYLHLSPAYIVKYATALYAKSCNVKYIHYGGGKSNAEDDALFMFKKKFGSHYLPQFCVGKRIYDKAAYALLCEAAGVNESGDFFPMYRRHI